MCALFTGNVTAKFRVPELLITAFRAALLVAHGSVDHVTYLSRKYFFLRLNYRWSRVFKCLKDHTTQLWLSLNAIEFDYYTRYIQTVQLSCEDERGSSGGSSIQHIHLQHQLRPEQHICKLKQHPRGREHEWCVKRFIYATVFVFIALS